MFKLIKSGDNVYYIQDSNSQKCMHVRGASHELRSEIWTWSCNEIRNKSHAQFKFIPVK